MARVEQRISDLDSRVTQITPAVTTVAALSERVGTLRDDFASFRRRMEDRDDDLRKRIEERDDDLRTRDEEARKDRRAAIRWAITLTVTLFLGLIAAIATIISSVVH